MDFNNDSIKTQIRQLLGRIFIFCWYNLQRIRFYGSITPTFPKNLLIFAQNQV